MNPDQQIELEAARTKLARYEQTARDSAKSAAIANALGEYQLNPGAAEQLALLIGPDAQVHDDGGRLVVTGPGLTPLNEHLRAKLAQPEFAHFQRTQTGRQQAPRMPGPGTVGAPTQQPDESLGAFIARRGIENQGAAQAAATDPRADMSKPFGLGRGEK